MKNITRLFVFVFTLFGFIFLLPPATIQAADTHTWLRNCSFNSENGYFNEGTCGSGFAYFNPADSPSLSGGGTTYTVFNDNSVVLYRKINGTYMARQDLLSSDGLYSWSRTCNFDNIGVYFDSSSCPLDSWSEGKPSVSLQVPGGATYNSYTNNGNSFFFDPNTNGPTTNDDEPSVYQYLTSIDGKHSWTRKCKFNIANADYSSCTDFAYFTPGSPSLTADGNTYDSYTDNNAVIYQNPSGSNSTYGNLYVYQNLTSLDGRHAWSRVCKFNPTVGSVSFFECTGGTQQYNFKYVGIHPILTRTNPPGDGLTSNAFTDNGVVLFDKTGANDNHYDYAWQFMTAYPDVITMGDLKIVPFIAGGAVAGTYGVSGLRADDPNLTDREGGSSYNNAITITQNVGSGTNSVVLVATAFVSKSSLPSPTPPAGKSTLYELTRSAYSDTGFVLLYANRDKAVDYYSCTGTPVSCSTASQSFTAGKYYVYFKGSWGGPYQTDSVYRSTELQVRIGDGSASAPQFIVTLLKPIGNHVWANYGYIMNTSNVETTTSLAPSQ